MNNRRVLFAIMIAFALVLGAASMAVAEEQWEILTDRQGNITIYNLVTGYEIIAWFEFDENGNRVDLDLVKYATLVNAGIDSSEAANMISKSPFATHNIDLLQIDLDLTKEDKIDIIPLFPVHQTRYIEQSRQLNVLRGWERVSPEFLGPRTSMGWSGTITTNHSLVWNINVSIIRLGASFTWNNQTSRTLSSNEPIAANRIAWVEFNPRINRTSGEIVTYLPPFSCSITTNDRRAFSGYSPVRLPDSSTDGQVRVVSRAR